MDPGPAQPKPRHRLPASAWLVIALAILLLATNVGSNVWSNVRIDQRAERADDRRESRENRDLSENKDGECRMAGTYTEDAGDPDC